MPILFHTGIGARYPKEEDTRRVRTSSAYMRPVCLDKVARAFPGLNIIAAHLGFPWCAEAAFLSIMHPNFFYDLAGVDRTETLYPTLTAFKDLLLWHPNGFGKLLFGTEGTPKNLAWVKAEYQRLLTRHGTPGDTIQAVMGLTAKGLLGL